MNYLVLGGNGYIGKNLVEKLSEDLNNQIIVADYNIENNNQKENVKYRKINFITCNNFDEYLNNIDVVVHLICTTLPNEDKNSINSEVEKNVFPTVRLLDSMVKNKTKKIVFLSSGGTVYGEHDLNPIKEDEQKKPICNYGIIKLLTEKYMDLYYNNYHLDSKIIRLSNPYSEHVKNGRKQGIVPIIVDRVLKGEEITIFGDGEDVRDYIYMDDAIEAINKVINYDGEERYFNVGTGVGKSINDLIRIIQNKMPDYNMNIKYVNARNCDVRNNILDITKIKNVLNWNYKVSIEEGIEKVINSMKREVSNNDRRKR